MTISSMELIETTDFHPNLMCEDERPRDHAVGEVKAQWYTCHGETCGYFICTSCKYDDQKVIQGCIIEGTEVICYQCNDEHLPPESIKFYPI